MKRLTLDALFIGNTDAKNELLTGSSQEVSSFKNGFLMPDNVVGGQNKPTRINLTQLVFP